MPRDRIAARPCCSRWPRRAVKVKLQCRCGSHLLVLTQKSSRRPAKKVSGGVLRNPIFFISGMRNIFLLYMPPANAEATVHYQDTIRDKVEFQTIAPHIPSSL